VDEEMIVATENIEAQLIRLRLLHRRNNPSPQTFMSRYVIYMAVLSLKLFLFLRVQHEKNKNHLSHPAACAFA
jgi:hypothetical protein